ncbi:hypothetical protein MPLB_210052 [Mesorhizobium sp. ORS 3324]|nr:hypothetical protein MPLB_210052 [Mesorhizobium sp. ORS 3324]
MGMSAVPVRFGITVASAKIITEATVRIYAQIGAVPRLRLTQRDDEHARHAESRSDHWERARPK